LLHTADNGVCLGDRRIICDQISALYQGCA
jgi:hypothetical protein